jgi:hypothetical protein
MITLDLSILNQKGTPMFYSDTLALRPAFGIAGRIFIDTASPYGIYRDTGTSWVQIASVGGGGGGIGGSGTATQIAFFSAATTLSSSANLFWDNTNARLGVNTATPSSSLDVHSTSQAIIQANNTSLGNAFLTFLLQDVGKWQIGNVYNAGANYFRIRDQLNSIERFTIQNTGEIDFLGYSSTLNTLTGITGTTPSALTNSGFTNDFTFNSGISTSASVNAIGLLVDNGLNYSGANTINATSYNASGLFRIGLTFGSAAASITYTQGATAQIRALTSNQVQYIQNGNNSGTISHFANIQILGDNKSGSGLTTFTNRYGLLINDFNDFGIGNTYTNRWGIYQQGLNENNFFAGKVGIGSGYSPSTFQLNVIGTSKYNGTGTFETTDGSTVLNLNQLTTNTNSPILNLNFNQTGGAGGGLLTITSSSNARYLANFNNISYIDANGKFFIGVAASYGTNSITSNGDIRINSSATESITSSSGGLSLVTGSATNGILINFTTVTNGSGISVINSFSGGSGSGSCYTLDNRGNNRHLYFHNNTTNPTVLTNSGSLLLGTTTENTSALLNITSTTKGVLFPRMTTTEKNAITGVAGLVIYDTTLNKLCVYTTSWETVTSL